MKHITEEYGVETNLLEMKTSDFDELHEFLKNIGVDLRMVSEYAGICKVQAKIHSVGGYWED